MRLTATQRQVIREAGRRHFGIEPRLFGSRLNDAQRGGDIDLYIPYKTNRADGLHPINQDRVVRVLPHQPPDRRPTD